jgi:deoxyribonuclease V
MVQRRLCDQIVREDRFADAVTVGGVDVAYGRRGGDAQVGVVVLELATLTLLDRISAIVPVDFPYVPGFLSFREAPAAIAALDRLSVQPDILICDGHGIAHPRRLGFASHLGLYLDRPTIGVAKSRLCGTHDPPGSRRGDWTPLVDHGEEIGRVLRSRAGCNPIYVSIGHRISLESAMRLVQACITRYRLPEPTRLADKLSKLPR